VKPQYFNYFTRIQRTI
jgi:hypothetical protein